MEITLGLIILAIGILVAVSGMVIKYGLKKSIGDNIFNIGIAIEWIGAIVNLLK